MRVLCTMTETAIIEVDATSYDEALTLADGENSPDVKFDLESTAYTVIPENPMICPRCGSDDVSLFEYVFRRWPICRRKSGALVVPAASDTVIWEASDGPERMTCGACYAEWPKPEDLEIEWL
jgi:hypothetical protein